MPYDLRSTKKNCILINLEIEKESRFQFLVHKKIFFVNKYKFLFYFIFYHPQEKVKAVFDNLIQLEHLNIVKFHKYWADVKENRARVPTQT